MNLDEQKYLERPDVARGPVRLECWTQRLVGKKIYLCGRAYGHPRFYEGQWIETSRVLFIDGSLARTRNTLYQLGKKAGCLVSQQIRHARVLHGR